MPPSADQPRRVLVAKPGLDGHDRGAKVVARALRDAGYEVIYTGIRQKVAVIVEQALQEDVDLVGLSILSGAHLGLARQVVDCLRDNGLDDVKVVVGGTIPASDCRALLDLGVDAVFPTGTSIEAVVAGVDALWPGGMGGVPPTEAAAAARKEQDVAAG
ncbi:MAG TPA: cobalamin B12-binding domain-containing protein [Acidimicrobiia bacterium]|nr:cobalamin B12-binding domain-containing protein [Acidimicrobiia bacterium]HZQ79346.1 cobalamin B12-binding domain-containing protein [Acidimicrobiia bacterium]